MQKSRAKPPELRLKSGRKPGYVHYEVTRNKIQAGNIITRLQSHIDADEPLMEPSQVTAALGLLDRVIPKLQQTTLTGDKDQPVIFITRAE